MNLFCSHLTATLNLLPLGYVGTLAASAMCVALGRCTQRPYHAYAFDFVEFASAQHSLSRLNSVLAYSQISLTRSLHLYVFRPYSIPLSTSAFITSLMTSRLVGSP